MKRLGMILLSLTLLSSTSHANGERISDLVDGSLALLSNSIEAAKESETAMNAEIITKKVIAASIEELKDLNAATGIDSLENNPTIAIPLGLVSWLAGITPSYIGTVVTTRLTPTNKMKLYNEKALALQKAHTSAIASLNKATISGKGMDAAERAAAIQRASGQVALTNHDILQHQKTRPGYKYRAGRAIRHGIRIPLVMGAIAVTGVVVSDVLVITLPGNTNELLDNLYADIEGLQKLLVEVESAREEP